MGRILFLFLVVVGALAAVLALIVGAGMVGLAHDNARPTPVVAQATGPADGPGADSPATRPTSSPVAELLAARPDRPAPGLPNLPPAAVPPVPPPVVDARAAVPNVPAVAPGAAAAAGVVTALSIVRADGGGTLLVLKDGMFVNLPSLPTRQVSVKADVGGRVGSVRFVRDGGKDGPHVENAPPYTVLGDKNDKFHPWDLTPGEHSVTVTPFAGPNGEGPAGSPVTVRFTVLGAPADPGIVLPAAAATRHGRTLQLTHGPDGQEPNISSWRKADEYLEWDARPRGAGLYKVELTYACDAKDGGGEYELRVGRHRFTGTSGPTGGWAEYRTLEVGRLTLPADGVTVTLKPTKLEDGRALMKVRSVRLVPVR